MAKTTLSALVVIVMVLLVLAHDAMLLMPMWAAYMPTNGHTW